MKNSDKFLALWREYETLLRDAGTEPMAVEEKAGTKDGGRLRIIRQFRNYMSHSEDPGFLEPTPAMMSFLEKSVEALRLEGDCLKKAMRGVRSMWVLDSDMKCADAMYAFSKIKIERAMAAAPDGTPWGLVSVYSLLEAAQASKSKKLSAVLEPDTDFICAKPSDSMASLQSWRIVACTADGTPSGKLLGAYYPK